MADLFLTYSFDFHLNLELFSKCRNLKISLKITCVSKSFLHSCFLIFRESLVYSFGWFGDLSTISPNDFSADLVSPWLFIPAFDSPVKKKKINSFLITLKPSISDPSHLQGVKLWNLTETPQIYIESYKKKVVFLCLNIINKGLINFSASFSF